MKMRQLFVNIIFAGLLASQVFAATTNDANSGPFSVVNEVNASQYSNSLFHQVNDPVAGNKNGKITLVEFFDYQCPHCVDMSFVIDQLIAKNSNLRIVFKELPFRGPVSEFAAKAALAAKKQGKFFEMHEALMHSKQQSLTNVAVLEVAASAGLNLPQLEKDMKDPVIDQQIKDTMKLAQALRIPGTPAFFIGKTTSPDKIFFIVGGVEPSQFQDLLTKVSH